MASRFKIFSDPVHGFISVPKNLVLDIIQTPEVQRLRRIYQLGVGHLVFPGAEHTRFGHALGAMALMQDTLSNLSEKGTPISTEESVAAMCAALLHDIGHGPFSHTLEEDFIDGFAHEIMSRELILAINDRFGGALDLTLRIFDGTYERPLFHQLVSSQLDMDRLDYLRRDSYYTGVVEGEVGVQRIIKTLRAHPLEGGPNARIVVEAKGVHAIENYIVARKLMYWQVYLHKTVVSGGLLLRAVFSRMRRLLRTNPQLLRERCSPTLLFFLRQRLTQEDMSRADVREEFCRLDDTDILYSMKRCASRPDRVLADLCRRFIERDFFRVSFLSEPVTPTRANEWVEHIAKWLVAEGISSGDTAATDALFYFKQENTIHAAYENMSDSIYVLDRNGSMREWSETVDAAAVNALGKAIVKPFVCYPKEGKPEPEEVIGCEVRFHAPSRGESEPEEVNAHLHLGTHCSHSPMGSPSLRGRHVP